MYREDTLLHFFYPRYSNNHKAKVLHNTSLFVIVFVLCLYQLVLQAIPFTGVKILGYASNISAGKVISLTNERRVSSGLAALTHSPSLERAAKLKGEHMLANDYWAHVAPDGTEPWFFFTSNGYKYRYAGENLARDFSNPDSAVEAWMASPSHKENLLSGKYEEIGVAVVEGDLNGVDTTIIVQLFGTRLDSVASRITAVQAKPERVETAKPAEISENEIVDDSGPAIALISPEPVLTGEKILKDDGMTMKRARGYEFLISPFDSTKKVSFVILGVLTKVMVIDALIIFRKKITRVGGRSLAHITFMVMIIGLVLMARAGEIL